MRKDREKLRNERLRRGIGDICVIKLIAEKTKMLKSKSFAKLASYFEKARKCERSFEKFR